MLEANKSKLFERIFAVYAKNLLKRRFQTLKVYGLENLEKKEIPTVVYCNHSSWWDGLITFQISQKCSLDNFVMMEEKQLKDYKLFCRLGAFSVIRENPREAVKSINYAAKILRESPNRTLWIFPQGEILPNDLRPIKFFNGISRIIEKVGKCRTVCLSMRYEFLGEYKPEVFVRIEKPEIIAVDGDFDSKYLTSVFADNLTKCLNSLKTDVINDDLKDYENII